MRVKLFLAGGLLLFIYSCTSSKKEKGDAENINQIFASYSEAAVKNDFGSMMGFIYPELFKEHSKEELINGIKQGMDNKEYKIVINKVYTDSVSDVYNSGLNKYAMAQTRTDASFFIKKQGVNDSARQEDSYNNFCTGFRKKYGETDVKCDDSNKKVSVVMKSNTFFIYDSKYKKWYSLGDANPEYVEKFIPADIRSKFGK
jgi:hypothetical protein